MADAAGIKVFISGFAGLAMAICLLPAFPAAGAEPDGRPTKCELPLVRRLLEAAEAAPDAVRDDGSLYGVRRWRSPTGRSYFGLRFPGLLSCAYTVSAIFRGACHPIGELASVKAVDAALAGWRKVTKRSELKPGDVVFWKPTGGTILGFKCPGHWHVGFSVGGDVTIDNDWWSGKPKRGNLDRACTVFAYGRRPPEPAPADVGCPDGTATDRKRSQTIFARLRAREEGRKLVAGLRRGPTICYGDVREGILRSDGVLVLQRDRGLPANAARLGHLIFHLVEGLPFDEAMARESELSCDALVKRAGEREKVSHDFENELRKAFGLEPLAFEDLSEQYEKRCQAVRRK
jgi:hypothetical protein